MAKKKVMYLMGAGSTQGEVSFFDPSFSLLTKDVVEGIIKKIDEKKIVILKEVKNELTTGSDVEHLITLYENVGTDKHFRVAKKLKELFREEILDRLKRIQENIPTFFPQLSTALIDMHDIPKIDEELLGIMTVNYDDLLEKAIQKNTRGINYSIEVKNNTKFYFTKRDGFPILKLHGSFNWKKDYPVVLVDQYDVKESNVLWIPPGIEKKRDQYPFNLLWSKARELLECDILRIIGCSLNRNDMQLISLIFSMQKINTRKNFRIEIVDFWEIGRNIRTQYPYLRIDTILEIPECRSYLIDYSGISPSDELPTTVADIVSKDNSKTNIFEWWLRAKGNQLKKTSSIKTISTSNSFFENFINQNV